MLVNLPLDEFSKMVLNQPDKWKNILESTDFQVKFNLFILLINCILAPMSAGFYSLFESKEKNEIYSYRQLFSYYNSVYTLRILGFVFLLTAIKFVISFITESLGVASVSVSISIIISLLFTITIPIIIFDNQPLTQAMKSSASGIAPRLFTTLVALFIGIIVAFAGLFFFMIGVVLTLPFFYCVNYWLYRASKR